jgi:hypothetical protein
MTPKTLNRHNSKWPGVKNIFSPRSFPYNIFKNYILLKVFINKRCFRRFLNQKVKAYTCFWWLLVYSGQLGVIYDSQPTNRCSLEGVGVLARSPPSFLLVFWESYLTPSRLATHCFIAIQIRVKGTVSPDF